MSDNTIKSVILGEGRVGKTSILRRYFTDKFDIQEKSTVNPSFYEKKVENSKGENIKITFWDTAGQELFDALNTIYYKNSSGALIVYDLNLFEDTFPKVEKWVNEIIQVVGNDVVFVIVGNKFDLIASLSAFDDKKNIVDNFCKKYNCNHILTSAKSGYNIKEAFDLLIQKMILKNQGKTHKNGLKIVNDVSEKEKTKEKCC
jgi:small GTP-binding protein